MSGLLSHSKNSIPVWFCLFWQAEELHTLSYALLSIRYTYMYIGGCNHGWCNLSLVTRLLGRGRSLTPGHGSSNMNPISLQ